MGITAVTISQEQHMLCAVTREEGEIRCLFYFGVESWVAAVEHLNI